MATLTHIHAQILRSCSLLTLTITSHPLYLFHSHIYSEIISKPSPPKHTTHIHKTITVILTAHACRGLIIIIRVFCRCLASYYGSSKTKEDRERERWSDLLLTLRVSISLCCQTRRQCMQSTVTLYCRQLVSPSYPITSIHCSSLCMVPIPSSDSSLHFLLNSISTL